MNTGKTIQKINGVKEKISDLSFSPSGKWLASCSACNNLDYKNWIAVWDMLNPKPVFKIETVFNSDHNDCYAIRFTRDEKFLIGALNEALIKIDIAAKKIVLQEPLKYEFACESFGFVLTPKYIVLATKDKKVTIHDADTLKEIGSISVPANFWYLDVSADGNTIAVCQERAILLYDIKTKALLKTIDNPRKENFRMAQFSADGKFLIAAADMYLVRFEL